jgi:hypothetical protein
MGSSRVSTHAPSPIGSHLAPPAIRQEANDLPSRETLEKRRSKAPQPQVRPPRACEGNQVTSLLASLDLHPSMDNDYAQSLSRLPMVRLCQLEERAVPRTFAHMEQRRGSGIIMHAYSYAT